MASSGAGMVSTCAAMSAVAAVRDLGYLLKWIAHDWDDEVAVRILTNRRTAMPPAGKVLVVEVVIPRGTAGSDATRLDTTMLVFTGSQERTEGEYRNLPSSRPNIRQNHSDFLTAQHSRGHICPRRTAPNGSLSATDRC